MFTCCNDHRLPSPQQACTLWKCFTESWRLSKVLCWCRHSFPSRFHDPSCTTITLKSSQATKTKAIISHILERKTEEGNERERERENVHARSWSKHLLGGKCPGEEALRPLLCLVLLPLICSFLSGPSPRIYFEVHISIDPLFNAITPQNRLKPLQFASPDSNLWVIQHLQIKDTKESTR